MRLVASVTLAGAGELGGVEASRYGYKWGVSKGVEQESGMFASDPSKDGFREAIWHSA